MKKKYKIKLGFESSKKLGKFCKEMQSAQFKKAGTIRDVLHKGEFYTYTGDKRIWEIVEVGAGKDYQRKYIDERPFIIELNVEIDDSKVLGTGITKGAKINLKGIEKVTIGLGKAQKYMDETQKDSLKQPVKYNMKSVANYIDKKLKPALNEAAENIYDLLEEDLPEYEFLPNDNNVHVRRGRVESLKHPLEIIRKTTEENTKLEEKIKSQEAHIKKIDKFKVFRLKKPRGKIEVLKGKLKNDKEKLEVNKAELKKDYIDPFKNEYYKNVFGKKLTSFSIKQMNKEIEKEMKKISESEKELKKDFENVAKYLGTNKSELKKSIKAEQDRKQYEHEKKYYI